MEQKYTYIFLAENNTIKTYCFDDINKEFELLRYDGQEEYQYNDNFWSWWNKNASYCSNYPVDFCFITTELEHSIKNQSIKGDHEPIMECSMEAFEDDHELLKNVEDGFEIPSIKNSKLYEVQ